MKVHFDAFIDLRDDVLHPDKLKTAIAEIKAEGRVREILLVLSRTTFIEHDGVLGAMGFDRTTAYEWRFPGFFTLWYDPAVR